MNYQWLTEFMSAPQLADIIAYVLLLIAYIVQIFERKVVKKDNKATISKVDGRVAKLRKLELEMEEKDKQHQKEREEWRKENERRDKKIETLERAVRLMSNSKELTKNGVSHQVAKMLPVEDLDNVEVIPEETKEEN